MKKIVCLMLLTLLLPALAVAEVAVRLKGGLTNAGASGSNAQLEFDIAPLEQSTVSPLVTLGYFDRTHSKKVASATPFPVPGASTTLNYKATGYLAAIGLRIKTGEQGQVETKLEFSTGTGKPGSSGVPGFGNQPSEDSYSAQAFILGYYYTFTPGVQLGIELGAQAFDGEYKTNVFGQKAKVSGSSALLNVTLGYRF